MAPPGNVRQIGWADDYPGASQHQIDQKQPPQSPFNPATQWNLPSLRKQNRWKYWVHIHF